jgi:hypothetical protein
MNDDREVPALRDGKLGGKDTFLRITRRKVVVEIQTDLTDRDDARVFAQFLDRRKPGIVGMAGIMRVIAHRGVDHRMAVRQLDGALAILKVGTGIDDEPDASVRRTGEYLIAVRFEFASRQMRMGVNERHV